jgi:AcrR family transcriptional regulator
MGTPADSAIVRQRLLDAACAAFAEHGYQHATVRNICSRAGVNGGAVNYHFGSKRELYARVLRLAELPLEPPHSGGNRAAHSSEDRLFRFISFFLESTLGRDEPTWSGRVLANELANPTDLFDELIREAIEPHFSRLRSLIGDILGPGAGRQTIDDHAFGVVSQVVFYRHSRPIIERLAHRKYGTGDMQRLARHVFDCVHAALESERAKMVSGQDSAEPSTPVSVAGEMV